MIILSAKGYITRPTPHVLSGAFTKQPTGDNWLALNKAKFYVTNISEDNYLLIPKLTSEKRRYIPIGFMDSTSLSSDLVFIMTNATKYHFVILTSSVHMAWMRAVAGRFKGDYRYSKNIVFNNFPWPVIDSKIKENITQKANEVLNVREKYQDWSYAELYDALLMPIDLLNAHKNLDKAVMEAYGVDWGTMTEAECVAELMTMYKILKE